jgi:hypothetical protein
MPSTLAKFVSAVLLILQVLVASARGQVLYIPLGGCETPHGHSHRADDCLHGSPASASLEGEDAGLDVAHNAADGLCDSTEHCRCHLHVPVPSDPQLPRQARATSPESPPLFASIDLAALCRHQSVEATASLSAQATSTPRHQLIALRSTRLRI